MLGFGPDWFFIRTKNIFQVLYIGPNDVSLTGIYCITLTLTISPANLIDEEDILYHS